MLDRMVSVVHQAARAREAGWAKQAEVCWTGWVSVTRQTDQAEAGQDRQEGEAYQPIGQVKQAGTN